MTLPPSRPAHLRPLDYLFRPLAILSPLLVGVLVVDLWGHPNAPGVAGHSFLLRVLFGLFIGPAMLLLGAVLLWRAAPEPAGVGRFFILVGLFMIGGQFSYELATPQLSGLAFALFMIGAARANGTMTYQPASSIAIQAARTVRASSLITAEMPSAR